MVGVTDCLTNCEFIYLLLRLYKLVIICYYSGTAGQVKPENKSGLPAKALVFTYNADCCESTRQFFDQHRTSVKELENKYGNRVQFTWYDVAAKDEAYQKEVLEAAKKVDVHNIPAFVVLDGSSNVLTRQIGQLKTDEVNKIFEGLSR